MEIPTNFITLIATILSMMVLFTVVFLRYKRELKEIQSKEEKQRVEFVPESIDNLSNLLIKNFATLNSYYSEHLSLYSRSALASIVIAIIGFIVIIAGILVAVIGNQITLGTVSSGAGIISEAAAFLFFKQTRLFQEQVQDSLKKLVSTQYLMTSISLAKELDDEKKPSEVAKINEHLRFLMNVLHGAKT